MDQGALYSDAYDYLLMRAPKRFLAYCATVYAGWLSLPLPLAGLQSSSRLLHDAAQRDLHIVADLLDDLEAPHARADEGGGLAVDADCVDAEPRGRVSVHVWKGDSGGMVRTP